ncbi:hypothetical protein [uncultured Brevundimonas sp.]|uniref:hypothetical protein n=1 Tax=uncultured Brevundimonas sp. TaxID=213418 RepID=UPI0025DE2CCA|nr:hypothetical protein [uncultured Brevundimonas sp.]
MTAALIPHPAASRHQMRQRLTTLIDRLIVLLDDIDGDADLEDDGTAEPSLAFQEARSFDSQDEIIRWSPTGGPEYTDLEEACEDEGAPSGDYEPEDYE